MTKKILCVGAGPFQLKGIERVKEMGLYVIATDGNPSAPGLKIADAPVVMDIKDSEGHIQCARDHKIDGVLTIASDVAVRTVAAVSHALGLPGISPEVAERCTDKELMCRAFQAYSVPSPRSYAVTSLTELIARASEIDFPVVVKPVDSAGSRGVRMVAKREELEVAFHRALVYSKKGKVIVEEFMEGVEVSVEAFVYDGTIHIVALSDKQRTLPPYLLDIQVTFPSGYAPDIQDQIIAVARRAIEAVGITMGPVHMELMMTKTGPIPVELAARGPGFKVFTDIIPMVTGVDVVKAVIDMALGEPPLLVRTHNRAASILFFDAKKEGVVREVRGVDEIRAISGVWEVEVYVKPGERVRTLTSGADRVGHVIAVTSTRRDVMEVVKKAASLFHLEVD